MQTPLAAIAALVRAGAVEQAWGLFAAEGHGDRVHDPAALALRGRLLKARGRLAPPLQRSALFAEAAQTYAAAHAAGPAPYLAINAATLQLLAGDPAAAAASARKVLALLDADPPPADTPYFLAATRAEALLLLGDRDGAERAMELAVQHGADNWADRASTIAQLGEIAEAQGADPGWLRQFAPPASLQFAGHMALVSDGPGEHELTRAIDKLIADQRIGFAWGALAAGSDIVIAERILAAGGELHVVLPCPPEPFAAQSVRPAGAAWAKRFTELTARATSVRWAAADPVGVHDPLATAQAGELAIGAALLNASALAAGCAQLIVTDAAGGGRNTARQAEMWYPESGPQLCLTIPRETEIEALFPAEQPDPARALAVHVAIQIEMLVRPVPLSSRVITELTGPVSKALAQVDPRRVRAGPGRWELIFDDTETALGTILAVQHATRGLGSSAPAIGAHIAITNLVEDPVSAAIVPYGSGIALTRRIQAMAPAGTALISDALAMTMIARRSAVARSELYHSGDDDSEGAVHLLLAR